MITAILDVATPADFSFAATIHSHGWLELPPFAYDEERRVLSVPHRLRDGTAVLRLSSANDRDLAIEVQSGAALSANDEDALRGVVRAVLGLDQDIAAFRGFIGAIPGYGWMAEYRLGRFLASPTVWQDLAKTLATTNTTWSGTVTMCQRLTLLGEPASDLACFPTPEEVAALAPDRLAEETKLGYRAAYLHELATSIANGDLDVEAWRDDALPTDELYRQITSLKGFGAYAAGNMLRLLGRHERLAIDTVVHKMFRESVNGGADATDREVEAHYSRFHPWAGLVVWLDAMRPNLIPYLDALGLPSR